MASDDSGNGQATDAPWMHDRLAGAALLPLCGAVSLLWFAAIVILATTIAYFWIDILKHYE